MRLTDELLGNEHDGVRKRHYHTSLRINTATVRITCHVGYRKQNSCNALVAQNEHAGPLINDHSPDEYAKRVDYEATIVHTKAR